MDQELRDKVFSAVDGMRDEIIQFAQDILRIPSITGEELKCSRFIEGRMREMGLAVSTVEVEVDRPNVLSVYKGSGDVTLGLNAHIDVVPLGDLSKWKVDPWGAEIVDGKMWARGAADCKGGIVCGAMAVRALQKLGVQLKGNVLLTAVVDDEKGSYKGMQHLVEKKIVQPEAVIQGDPSTKGLYSVTTAHNGYILFELVTEGKAWPTGFPQEAINAVEKMADIMVGMRQLELPAKPHPLFPLGVMISVGTTIQGGIGWTIIPDRCRATFDVRVLPEHEREETIEGVQRLLRKMSDADPELKVQFIEHTWVKGDSVPQDTKVVRVLQRAAAQVTGQEPECVGIGPVGSSSYLINYAKIPTIIWGPGAGTSSQAHSFNEWVGVEDMVAVTKGYCLAAINYLGYEA